MDRTEMNEAVKKSLVDEWKTLKAQLPLARSNEEAERIKMALRDVSMTAFKLFGKDFESSLD